MKKFMMAFVAAAMISLCGCQKISDQEKALISTVQLDAQERAAAWDLAKAKITAVNPADADAVAHFIANQSDSLHKLADGLKDTGDAITSGSPLSQNMRDAISQEADTASARAADLSAMSKFITADAPTLAFLAAHQASLNSEAANLQQLKAAFAADASKKK